MSEQTIGYGTAFESVEDQEWQAAEDVSLAKTDVLDAIRDALGYYDVSEEEFNDQPTLYLTEIRTIRPITWEDVKP